MMMMTMKLHSQLFYVKETSILSETTNKNIYNSINQ